MRIGKKSKEEEHSIVENKMEKVKYIKEWGEQREQNKAPSISNSLLAGLPYASYNILKQHPKNLSLSNPRWKLLLAT